MYIRVLLLVTAYGGVVAAASLFPRSPIWELSAFIGEVMFSPFKLLAACLLFIAGFLAYSSFVRDLISSCIPHYTKRPGKRAKRVFACAALGSFVPLLLTQGLIACFALFLALWYGIMDVGFMRKRWK
ncbi:hypothetical protein M3212_20020 [Alkalihalobacillus oceani]|uniref:hypothetical protein n=1 Tax=Halalkalibacter oceani TaxID=1653776 RepID=UPI00203CBEC2|nr:hypothetical protein [Halalkalibacter oceani]MCM3763017.1 hypothetical protein [Halalkalibacter oceani]